MQANKRTVERIAEDLVGATLNGYESDSSFSGADDLTSSLQKPGNFDVATANEDAALAHFAKLKRRRQRINKRMIVRAKPKKRKKKEDVELKKERKCKTLMTYRIPKEKFERARELLNAGNPSYMVVEHPKIHKLVRVHRNVSRIALSPVRQMHEILACMEQRDYRNAVTLLRLVLSEARTPEYAIAARRLILCIVAMDPIAQQNNYMQKFLENVYGIAEEHQHECLLEISKLPQSLPVTRTYNTISRYLKAEEKLASAQETSAPTQRLRITGVYGGVKDSLLAQNGEMGPSTQRWSFKKFES